MAEISTIFGKPGHFFKFILKGGTINHQRERSLMENFLAVEKWLILAQFRTLFVMNFPAVEKWPFWQGTVVRKILDIMLRRS